MFNFFRVERNAALLLVVAALVGWVLAHSPVQTGWIAFWGNEFDFGWIHLSFANFVGEFLMAAFFLLVGIELKKEWIEGVFTHRKSILRPTLAAAFGALAPALLFVLFNAGDSQAIRGWAIPMPTDLTFSLAVFALFGRGWPAAARVFILAFAVIDDLIAVLVIAASSINQLQPLWLLAEAAAIGAFWIFRARAGFVALTSIGLIGWYFSYRSGIQPAICGALFGLLLTGPALHRTEQRLHLAVAILVLPVFAVSATSLSISAFDPNSNLTLAILLRPLAKVFGIMFGVAMAALLVKRDRFEALGWLDYWSLAPLGGIGFSVSILIANQAFGQGSTMAQQSILATLIAAIASAILAAAVLRARAFLGGFSNR
jgi:NhaA family Na+:H+ antiporter